MDKDKNNKYLSVINIAATILAFIAIALLFNGYLTQSEHNMHSDNALLGKIDGLEKRVEALEARP